MEYLTLVTTQELKFGELQALEASVNTMEQPSREYLQGLLASLEDQYAKLCDLHVNLSTHKPKVQQGDVSPDLYNPSQLATIQAKYFVIKGKIFSLMPPPVSLSRQGSHESLLSQHSSQLAQTRSHVKFPTISLPKFSGDSDQWLNFRDLFQSIVVSKDELSNEEKLHYLKSCLSGEAMILTSNSSLDATSFTDIWKALKKRYDNKLDLMNNALKHLFSFENEATDLLTNLKRLRDVILTSISTLKSIDRPVDTWDDLLIYVIAGKLDKATREMWDNKVGEKEELPILTEMLTFLDTRIRINSSKRLSEPKQNVPSKSTIHTHQTSPIPVTISKISKEESPSVSSPKLSQTKFKSFCHFCKSQGHSIVRCDAFRALTPTSRVETIRSSNVCLNCLGKHDLNACVSKHTCHYCGQLHHSLLHEGFAESSGGVSVHISSGPTSTPILLATARVRVAAPSGRTILARAILDPCSECSIVSERLVQNLLLKKERTSATISGVNGSTNGHAASAVHFMVESQVPVNSNISVRAYVLPKVTAYSPPKHCLTELPRSWHGLKFADPFFQDEEKIDLLFGADVYGSIVLDGLLKSEGSPLLAQNSVFGWVLSGPLSKSCPPPKTLTVLHVNTEDTTDRLIQKFWEIEEAPKLQPFSSLEQDCEDHFIETHIRLPSGQYQVNLPFLKNAPQLGESKNLAEKQLLRTERKRNNNSDLDEHYTKFMLEYENLGHMTRIGPLSSHYSGQNFLTHFPVLREESLTTKFRIVFNGSAPTSNGISLNDCLHIGPPLLTDLPGIILRWRLPKFVLKCDVSKMFRQIAMHPKDKRFQCILWRNSSDQPIDIYELNTVTYGLRSSPYQSNRVVRQLALDEFKNFPEAAYTLLKDVYVDDFFFGGETLSDTLKLRNDIISVTNSANLSLRKWASNHPDLVHDLGEEINMVAIDLPFSESQNVPVLGIQWNPASDSFQYKIKIDEIDAKPTKRDLLSKVSKIFDPMGWLSPVIIQAKILLQSLWLLKLNWDDVLPPHIQRQWFAFQDSYRATEKISIPRWVPFDSQKNEQIQIHGFCDASEKAYGAVLYLRSSIASKTTVSILLSKTRVAPLKTVSVPRLELCAAALLADLVTYALANLPLPEGTAVHCWSDSAIVLSWLQRPPYTWKVFVANRVSQIQTSLPDVIWRHVPTSQNPADMASRGVDSQTLTQSTLWWSGPKWLIEPSANWPPFLSVETPTELETRKSNVFSHTTTNSTSEHFIPLLISRCSKWVKVLRILAIVRRFGTPKRLRSASKFWLTSVELDKSVETIVRFVQEESFASEIKALASAKPIPSNSNLISLNPSLDKKGLIRTKGRVPTDPTPFILPKGEVARLVVRQVHENNLHPGTKLTLYLLRRQYWVIHARSLVKTVIHNCVECTRFKAKTSSQLMGVLPLPRVESKRVFLHTGLDYAGPFTILRNTGRGSKPCKVWVVLFVCLSVKAVHIEFVLDCSTHAFVNAFRRFCAQCGLPSDLYSDNATTFKGADRELKSFLSKINQDPQVHSFFAHDHVTWHFLPPSSPHFGGLWEAGVKSVKKHLKPLLTNKTPTLEEFITMLKEIQGLLNSRPIAPLFDDLESLEALTPGHFLIGEPIKSVPTPSFLDLTENRLNRWQKQQRIIESFWKKWSVEYVQTLQTRSKWTKIQPNLEIGDFVLIKNDLLPPGKWERGRIVDTSPGLDGLVRAVKVKTASSIFSRPIVKLVRLPVRTSQD